MNEVFHHQPGSKVLLVGSYQWNGYFHDSFENCHIEACIHDNPNLANSVWMKFKSLKLKFHRITWRHKIVGPIYAPLPINTSSCLLSIKMVKTVEVRCPRSTENHKIMTNIWPIYLAIYLHNCKGNTSASAFRDCTYMVNICTVNTEKLHHNIDSLTFQLVEATQVPLTDPVIQAVGP